ncbi:hypothetical protein D6833_06650 [Candidatus Parcubacteria bacterium]|nr:MAG: hypothetical protein D6833_06650 [Candidatus Parcubacteria bacterium]
MQDDSIRLSEDTKRILKLVGAAGALGVVIWLMPMDFWTFMAIMLQLVLPVLLVLFALRVISRESWELARKFATDPEFREKVQQAKEEAKKAEAEPAEV